jgi:hypothetical protein
MSMQIVLAAPIVAATATTGTGRATCTANEPGVLHLSDSVLTGAMDSALANAALDFSEIIEIVSIKVNGSTLLVRGRSSPSTPNIFTPHRKGNLVALPDIRVASADTVELAFTYVYAGGQIDSFFGIPFTPDRFAQTRNPIMGANEVWVGSPATAVADDTDVTITATLSDSGLVDLSRIAFKHELDPTSNVNGSEGAQAAWVSSILSLQVASRYEIIVSGSGTAAAPMGMFSLQRARNLVNLGVHRVDAGDTVVAHVRMDAGAAGDASFGFPMFTGKLGALGACSPCR